MVEKKYNSNGHQNLFGNYIRDLRIQRGIGQRELARKIEVSASYLNDIEKNKRPAPRSEIIKALAGILEADDETINDLAGNLPE